MGDKQRTRRSVVCVDDQSALFTSSDGIGDAQSRFDDLCPIATATKRATASEYGFAR